MIKETRFEKKIASTYPCSIRSTGCEPIRCPPGTIGPIGCPGPWPNGDPGGILNCGPPKPPGPLGDGKCGPPNPAGPELFGLLNGGPPDGDPNGPPAFGPGPLYGGPLDGGGGKPAPLTFAGGPGPGVDDPDGAGDAVYCGVLEPGGGPWYWTGCPLLAGLPCPAFGNTATGPPNELGPDGVNPPWLSGPGGPPFHPAAGSSSVDGKLKGPPGGTPRLPTPEIFELVESIYSSQLYVTQ